MLRLHALLAGSLLLTETAAAQIPSLPPATPADTTAVELKSPTLARLIGIIPGAGHLYAGEAEQGLIIATAISGVLLAGALADAFGCLAEYGWPNENCERGTATTVSFVVAGGVWGWSIFDAGRAATRTNRKRTGSASLHLGTNGPTVRLGLRIRTYRR